MLVCQLLFSDFVPNSKEAGILTLDGRLFRSCEYQVVVFDMLSYFQNFFNDKMNLSSLVVGALELMFSNRMVDSSQS